MTATDVLGNEGQKPTIVWKGVTYSVSFNCPKVAQFMEQEVMKHLLDSIAKTATRV